MNTCVVWVMKFIAALLLPMKKVGFKKRMFLILGLAMVMAFCYFRWPKDKDLQKHYPIQDLVTGPDIIFFWVARMIMAGLYFKQEIPFSNVYFNGLI